MGSEYPVFDLTQRPPSKAEISAWRSELLHRQNLYGFWGQHRVWRGAVALAYVFWAVIVWPRPLGEMLSGALIAFLASLVTCAIVDLWIGDIPVQIRHKIQSLSTVDEETYEAVRKVAAQDKVIENYLRNMGDRPLVWVEYWSLSQYAGSTDALEENDDLATH